MTALPKKLTRAELIDHIVEKFNIHKTVVNLLLEHVFDDIKKALAEGRSVELRSFGTFEIHVRAGRKARNPKTGEKLVTQDRGVVFFRPGREMKTRVKKVKKPSGNPGAQTDRASIRDAD
ncbi:MAG: integration host factor subunit beta [Spirochaetales bacterium]|nr:integration host factor subunit beta [Spirochaetales bacterium]